jgi:hypothetical protein
MKNKVVSAVFTAVVLILCSGSPFAQGLPGRGRDGFPRSGPPGFDILRVEPLELSDPVVDVPFSADTITELTQQLADGNRIEQQTKGNIARDSRGRIRSEQTLARLGPATGGEGIRMVTITDPVRREQYRLDEMRKIAWKMQLPPPRSPRREGSGGPPLPPRQSVKTEQLDATQFDGVKAEGTRAILVLPPKSIGNERAIEVVSERWYSPELRIVVATKRIDPRFGDTSYRLVNIVRAEPPGHLFEVPADFTVRDQPAFPPPPR